MPLSCPEGATYCTDFFAPSGQHSVEATLHGWFESACMRTIDKIEYLPHGDKPGWANFFLSLTINRNTGTFFCKTHFIIGGQCEFNGQIFAV